jgi:hypothetical protein
MIIVGRRQLEFVEDIGDQDGRFSRCRRSPRVKPELRNPPLAGRRQHQLMGQRPGPLLHEEGHCRRHLTHVGERLARRIAGEAGRLRRPRSSRRLSAAWMPSPRRSSGSDASARSDSAPRPLTRSSESSLRATAAAPQPSPRKCSTIAPPRLRAPSTTTDLAISAPFALVLPGRQANTVNTIDAGER